MAGLFEKTSSQVHTLEKYCHAILNGKQEKVSTKALYPHVEQGKRSLENPLASSQLVGELLKGAIKAEPGEGIVLAVAADNGSQVRQGLAGSVCSRQQALRFILANEILELQPTHTMIQT